MTIESTSAAAAISSAGQSATAEDVSLLVLKKAQDSQASAALALIKALPTPPPPLATQGSVGTQLNIFA